MDTPIIPDIANWINDINDQSLHHDHEVLDDHAPKMEMEFENEEVAYNYYNEYGRRMGFRIRKEYRNLSKKDGVLTSRKFSCHKEGETVAGKRDHLTKDAETRTGCQACMIICLDRKVGKYKVSHFVAEHNHVLTPASYIHMMSSQRCKDNWNGQHKDGEAHFTNRYRELCPRIENLVKRACESHETYTFMCKVYEESSKVIEQMLAQRQCVDDKDTDTCHVSIPMTSQEVERNADAIDCGSPEGINQKANAKRPKNCLEATPTKNANAKATAKSKASTKPKHKQSEGASAMTVQRPTPQLTTSPTDYLKPQATDNRTFTELLTVNEAPRLLIEGFATIIG